MEGRNRLGIGSRLSRSADGVLQGFPSLPPIIEPHVRPKQPSIVGEEAPDDLEQSGGAVLGVQVDLSRPSGDERRLLDSISDAILVSGPHTSKRRESKRSLSDETDLVAGRADLESAPAGGDDEFIMEYRDEPDGAFEDSFSDAAAQR
eukprot:1282310-Prymnesium_polylepis.1